ncbi:MAG: YbaN family protein [Peptococcaceae bacterium]|nr:YbaN family protein [Peptococcaceae bacterium]
MTLIRLLLIALGCICLGLGTIGAFLPVLPTVPLYLLATILFAKSSTRLHRWFTSTNLYKKNLESYVQGQGMTFVTKLRIAITITVSMAIGCWFVSHLPMVQLVLGIIWLSLMIYFFAVVKTRRQAE